MESKNNAERKSTIIFYERLKLKCLQNSLKSRIPISFQGFPTFTKKKFYRKVK